MAKFWLSKNPTLQSMCLNRHAETIDALERPEILHHLPSFANSTVLDLGAGIGRFTGEFAKSARKVIALDFSPHFLEANQQAHICFSNIEYLCSDATRAKFPPHSFDLIFISWLFMYLNNSQLQRLSRRITRWLKPQGILFFRESCAPKTTLYRNDGYYAHYRSMPDYSRLFPKLTLLKQDNIRAYEDLSADAFKCFWVYKKPCGT
ncbi:MAG TPA: methyltransferase domain-containing protein [Chlamydiales bacterium]|nr:methyltransferase domain-containing protein [Chlamydiales bacterium]